MFKNIPFRTPERDNKQYTNFN
jgi:hypothetical protein